MDPDSGMIRVKSQDPLEHSALLEPWDLQISQVTPGAFTGTVDAVRTPSTVVYEEHWGQGTAVRGSTPPGYVMFGVVIGRKFRRNTWCGVKMNAGTVACAGPGAEISVLCPRQGHQLIVLVQPETLAQGLGEDWRYRLSSRKSLHVPQDTAQAFGARAVRAVRRHLKRPELLSRPEHVRSLESDLMDALIRCTEPVDRLRPSGESLRDRAFRPALEVAASQSGRMTALELSVAAGASQRTLEYAFRAKLGITPARYLRALRLEGARRELLAADPRTARVSWIAGEWGFYHLGRFSARYREQFAELPSHTLRSRRPPIYPVLADLISVQPA